jgi:DNA-binding MarR family transcriptional regulator
MRSKRTETTGGETNPLVGTVNDELFEGSFDSVDALTDRKRALAHPLRYALLYRVAELEEVEQSTLAEESGLSLDDLLFHMRPLVETNLVGRVPAPSGVRGKQTYYRITTLGQQEIEADTRNVRGDV